MNIFDGICTDKLASIAEGVLLYAKLHPQSIGSNNRGGWKSDSDVFTWGGDFTLLANAIRAELARIELPTQLRGWAMINRRGSFHARHTHGGVKATGVFYVTPGDPATPTILELPGNISGEYPIEPIPGRLAIFGPMIWHYTRPYHGEIPRITIAFDVLRPGTP